MEIWEKVKKVVSAEYARGQIVLVGVIMVTAAEAHAP
jgi:hypothetical protein